MYGFKLLSKVTMLMMLKKGYVLCIILEVLLQITLEKGCIRYTFYV